jgi:predicted MFS family arabinose efflux permease
MAGVLSTIGPNVPFYFAAGLSLANAAAVYFFLPESVKHVATSSGKGRFAEILESFSERWFGLVNLVYFLLIMAFSIMTYAFSLYAGFAFGYDAAHVGWLFFYVGVIAIVGQGVIFHRAAVRFGESALAAAGCLMMAVSLIMLPFIDTQTGGLAALLFASAILSLGNAIASPALTSLVSKLSHEHEQGKSLGIIQSTASLARAIGPSLGGFLLNSSTNRVDHFTVMRTFGTASAIMFVTFVVAVYFSRFMRTQMVV